MTSYALRAFNGRVVRYWRQAGHGFLAVDGIARDAHFHVDDFDRVGGDEIETGDRLNFYLEDTRQGLKAIRISKVKR